MLKRYLNDTSGQFAIIFSVCSTALIMFVAGAVDVVGLQKNKSQLQAMTDAGVLAAASLRTDNIGELKKAAEAAINANNLDGIPLKIKVSLNNDIIQVSASSDYNTQLMGIMGVKEVPVDSISEAPVPDENPVNIALVLDSTGSMAGANMDALKSASKKLLEVFDASEPGTIQAGVVPYSDYVNIGLANRNRPWMNVDDDNTTIGAEVCEMTKDLISRDCTYTTVIETCRNDSGFYSCEKTKRSCTNHVYGPEYEKCETPTSSETWHGCVGSRDDPYHKDPDYKGKRFPGMMNVTCGTEILDLTDNLEDVGNHIDSLSASGNTYIPAGLMWGWRLLDADQPLGGLTNAETKRKRALVLMTDGANTVTGVDAPYHSFDNAGDKTPQTNALTLEVCEGIKLAGIDIYGIAYKLGAGDPTAQKMVADCASSTGHFFPAENQEDLEKAFEQIANSLYDIRLSR